MCGQKGFLKRVCRILVRVARSSSGHPQMLVMTMNEHGERRWITRYVSSEKFDIGTCIEHSPRHCLHQQSPYENGSPCYRIAGEPKASRPQSM